MSESATPILDLEQDPPKARRNSWRRWLSLVAMLAIGALIANLLPDDMPDRYGKWWPESIAWLLPALYLAVVIHESGHALTGKLVGLDVGGFGIGGFILMRSGQRWLFRFSLRWLLNFGGFVVPLASSREFPRSRFGWFVAGGPIASLLLTAACWVMVARSGDVPGEWIRNLFVASLICVACSAVPFSVQGMRSDGLVLWEIFRSPEKTRRMMTLMAIRAEEMRGVRPRDWSADLMQDVMKLEGSDGQVFYVQALAWYRYADEGNELAGLPHVENLLAAAGRSGNKALRRASYQLAAAASSSARKNAAQARVWLERAEKAGRPPQGESMEGVRAQIAMLEGRYEDALNHWGRLGENLARKHGGSGIVKLVKSRVEAGEQECRAMLGRAADGAAAS